MTSQDMTHDTGPGEDDEVVVAELVEDAGALEPRVPVVGVDPAYVDLYRRLRAEGGVDLREQLHNRYLQLARGGVTAGGLPWPSPTDPVAEGADAIRALAEAVDAKLAGTGWQPLVVDDGYTTGNDAAILRLGGVVYLRGTVIRTAGNFPAGVSTRIGELPLPYRPTVNSRYAAAFGDYAPGAVPVTVSGLLYAVSANGASNTVYLDTVRFPGS